MQAGLTPFHWKSPISTVARTSCAPTWWCKTCSTVIPNSFTPNNDGYNDAFFIEGTDIDPTRFRMKCTTVGEMIWFTTDPTDAWYGQVGDDGQHYAGGTYSYRVEVNSLSARRFGKRSLVTST